MDLEQMSGEDLDERNEQEKNEDNDIIRSALEKAIRDAGDSFDRLSTSNSLTINRGKIERFDLHVEDARTITINNYLAEHHPEGSGELDRDQWV